MELFLAVMLVVASAGAPGEVLSKEEAASIESQCLQNRRAVLSGEFVIDEKGRGPSGAYHRTRHIFIMDHLIREDKTSLPDGTSELQDSLKHTETTCFGQQRYYYYNNVVLPGDRKMVLMVQDINQLKNPCKVVDPRIVGMIPDGIANATAYFHLDSFVGGTERKNVSFRRDSISGEECVRADFEYGTMNAKVSVWISPDRGCSVVRSEIRMGFADSIEVDVRKHEESGMWFPIATHYKRLESSGKVSYEETLSIRVVSLNKGIDKAVFTPGTMQIPIGTVVSDLSRTRGDLVWDGTDIVDVGTLRHLATRSRLTPMLLAAFSILFMLFAALLVWRHRGNRLKGA